MIQKSNFILRIEEQEMSLEELMLMNIHAELENQIDDSTMKIIPSLKVGQLITTDNYIKIQRIAAPESDKDKINLVPALMKKFSNLIEGFGVTEIFLVNGELEIVSKFAVPSEFEKIALRDIDVSANFYLK